MRTWLLFLCLLSLPVLAQERRPIGAIRQVTRQANGILCQCQDGSQLSVTVLAPDVVRVRASFGKPLEAPDHSWAVVDPHWPKPSLELDDLTLKTAELTVSVQRNPVKVAIRERASGRLWLADQQPMAWEPGGSFRVFKDLALDEHFYGLGEKAAHLDHRRGSFTMWNSDTPGYHEGTDPIYQSIPFYVGLRQGRAYGVFLDNSRRSHFQMGFDTQEKVAFGADGGEANYYFLAGPSMQKVVSRYTELTGRPPLWPRWALGHQASRWSYYPDHLVEEVAHEYRRRKLPLDAINLDIHYMDGYRVFTWDHSRFPDPRGLIERLGREGIRVITIVDPGVKYDTAYRVCQEGLARGFFQKRLGGKLWVPRVWPGDSLMVDYTLEAARRWWGDLHKVFLDAGVAGIWNDMNEPADFLDRTGQSPHDVVCQDEGRHSLHGRMRNLFALLEARATYEGLKRLQPTRRPFVLTRAGYAGIQRYSTMWNGDTPSTWQSLALNLPMYANLGLSGESFVGGDVGGFMGRGNGELLVRSYQLGCLVPFCRNHKELSGYDQEPWRFGAPYEEMIRQALLLRYRLLPYLYAQVEEAHRSGLPVVRPLVLDYQDDETTYNLDDQVLIGPDLLLAPVLAAGQTSRRVYLPSGTWTDYWSGERLAGGRLITAEAPLERMPFYVRGGCLLPSGGETERVHEGCSDPLELTAYPDEQGRAEASVYEDDGITSGGGYRRTHFKLEGQTVGWSAEGSYPTKGRALVFRRLPGKEFALDGQAVVSEPEGVVRLRDDGQAHQLSWR